MRYILIIIAALIVCGASSKLEAQVSVNINIGTQPVWGPTGYDYAEYYYIPDIDVYYYIPLHRFYYYHNRSWIYSSNLPASYGNFDLYNCHKVIINERDPWKYNDKYRNEYASFKGRHDQSPIRDSKDSKYFVNKNHPQHNAWVQQQKQGKGNAAVQNKGNTRPSGPTGIRQNNPNKGITINQNKGNTKVQGNKGIRQNSGDRGNTSVQNKGNTRSQGNGNRPVQNKGNKGNAGNKGNGGEKGNEKDNGKKK